VLGIIINNKPNIIKVRYRMKESSPLILEMKVKMAKLTPIILKMIESMPVKNIINPINIIKPLFFISLDYQWFFFENYLLFA